jgi:PTH1 family peptidyl-tRNA hydrolase
LADSRFIIAGLGNPDKKYERTRHNAGFWVIDELANKLGVEVKSKKFSSRMGEAEYEDKKLILLKPWLYMNLSGIPVATVAGFYKIPATKILVISDDLSLPVGKLRFRNKGSAGGQKGLADVLEKLGTRQVSRLRIGIGSDSRIDAVDYVLGKPKDADMQLLAGAVKTAAEGVLFWLSGGIDNAMNRFNAEPKDIDKDNDK